MKILQNILFDIGKSQIDRLLTYHLELIGGNSKDNFELLKDELAIMKSFLQQTAKKYDKDQKFQEWESKIREAVYEAEDVIDEWVNAEVKAKSRKRKLQYLTGPSMKPSLAEDVKRVIGKMGRLRDQNMIAWVNLKLTTEESCTRGVIMAKRKQKPRGGDNIVGFEDEIKTLIMRLTDPRPQNLEVISIIGMPGLGKTTVAWKIYEDETIRRCYRNRIWVYVSQDLNIKDLLLNIMRQLSICDEGTHPHQPVEELSAMVRNDLGKSKFLMIMDDVWTSQAWDQIKDDVLPSNNVEGTILITSRYEKVAYHAKDNYPHRLRFLTPEESQKLLQLEVYGDKFRSFDEDLRELGERIAKSCKGLPLSIIIIGGVLKEKMNKTGVSRRTITDEWEKISESVQTHIMNNDDEKKLEHVIALSYNQLPYDLRNCFLYLGIFPEDSEIPASKIIQLWIAEGFIKRVPIMEEVAQDNLTDLISRNLLMVEKVRPDGEVKSCRLHDAIREFCKTGGALGRENLFQEIKMSRQGLFVPAIEESGYRRLCVHADVKQFLLQKPKKSKARSFLCFSKEKIILEEKEVEYLIDDFTLLRVLDVETIHLPIFPTVLPKLVHLRYLTLTIHAMRNLPHTISELWNLQTLIMKTVSSKLTINADIWKLTQLRYLKTKSSIILNNDDKEIGPGGENLQELSSLSTTSCRDDVFKKAKNLKILGIRGDLSDLMNFECLEELNFLHRLKLVHEADNKLPVPNNLPLLNKFPPKVRILMLSGTKLKWPHMSVLGNIRTLEVLKLKDNAFEGESWDVVNVSFSKLMFLHISSTDLKHWTTPGDPFPALRTIQLGKCEKLEEIPLAVAKNLEKLEIMEKVSESAIESARSIHDKLEAEGGEFFMLVTPLPKHGLSGGS